MLTRRTERLALPHDRPLLLGLVADTHGKPHPNATQVLRAEGAAQPLDAILHGGDVGDLAVLDALAEVAPVIAVRGNIESRGTACRSGTSTARPDSAGGLELCRTQPRQFAPRNRCDSRTIARQMTHHSLTARSPLLALALLVSLIGCGDGGSPAADSTAPSSDQPTAGGEAGSAVGEVNTGGETGGAGDVAPTHGASLWGVYVVVAAPAAPELEAAAAPLRARGINVSVGELGCDAGAAEALSAAPDAHAVSVMFATRADADRFAATLSTPPAGIAQITVGCAD